MEQMSAPLSPAPRSGPTLAGIKQLCENPPAAVISLADSVFTLTAMYQIVSETVVAYQTKILAAMQAHPDKRWTSGELGRALQDEPILDPKSAFLLSEANFATYDARCKDEAKAAKLKVERPDNCPMLELQARLTEAKTALLEAAQPFTGITVDALRRGTLKEFDRLVDMVLKMVAPRCDPHTRFNIERPAAEKVQS